MADLNHSLAEWPEFTGEISYTPLIEGYSWVLTFKPFLNVIPCKTEAQAESIAAQIRQHPECGTAQVRHDFDCDTWIVTQRIRKVVVHESPS